jgi:solute carrier family 35 protein E3
MTFSLQTAAAMALNFCTSVGIITVNKYVFKYYGFNYSTLLTGIHFIFTFVGLILCAAIGLFTPKSVPIRHIIQLSLVFTGFVVFNNLSLQYNSVGFYQLMKVLTTPAIVIVQAIYYHVEIHPKLKLSLVPICIGVCLATVSDVEVNSTGTTYAILGIISTSMYQIWIKTKQQDLKLDSYQLLFLQAPMSAVIVFFISVFTEPIYGPTGWMNFDYSIPSVTAIFASSVLAFLVNLSIFLVIGRTSPVAYNVLGHFKLCVILLSGFLFFSEQANGMKILGSLLTLAGVITYTHLQQNLKSGWENREKQTATVDAKVASSEEAEKLLNGNQKTPV